MFTLKQLRSQFDNVRVRRYPGAKLRSILCGLFTFLNLLSVSCVWAVEEVRYEPNNSFKIDSTNSSQLKNFGHLTIKSDSQNGWRLKVRSQYGGYIRHADSNFRIRYTLQVNGYSVNPNFNHDIVILEGNIGECSPPKGCNWLVQANISAGGMSEKPAGNYSDMLVFTLQNL